MIFSFVAKHFNPLASDVRTTNCLGLYKLSKNDWPFSYVVMKWLAMVAIEVILLVNAEWKGVSKKTGLPFQGSSSFSLTLFRSMAFCAYKSPSTSSYRSC